MLIGPLSVGIIMKRLCFFVLFILLCTPIITVQAQNQENKPSLNLTSLTWDKPTLKALIIEADSESWWRPEYTDAAKNAIADWNQAIGYFSSKYGEYSYVSDLNIVTEVSNQNKPGYDIYVNYTMTMIQGGQLVLGLATTYPKSGGIIDHCTITLATVSETLSLNNDGIRNVATHELGHALALGHSNSNSDLMYATNDLIFSENKISSLDFYGVATVFDWMRTGSTPNPSGGTVTLPDQLPFEYAPTTNQTPNPLNDISRIVQQIFSVLQQNIFLTLILIGVTIIIVGIAITFRPKRKQKSP